ncbi:MAG: hypothetical protein O3B73_10040, partial [bacterium]|nr:hypothetical protein [bacterium]
VLADVNAELGRRNMSGDEIRVHYATHFLKLSMWYVAHLMRTEKAVFQEAINSRVNVYRNTDFYEGGNKLPARGHVDPAWDDFLVGLKTIYDRYPSPEESEGLESEGLAYLWPRVRKGYHLPSSKGRPYACWTYDDGEDHIAIHIANVYQPESPLSEKYISFAATLLKLLRDTRQRRPEVVTLRCGSWMNSIKPFQAMFPQSWHDSARVSPKSGFGMGHWGQFMDRIGRFHERNGRFLRETGDFPFPSLGCHAPLGEVLTHLETNFPAAVSFLDGKDGQGQP